MSNQTSLFLNSVQRRASTVDLWKYAQTQDCKTGIAGSLRRVADKALKQGFDGIDDGICQILDRVQNLVQYALDIIND